MELTIVLLLLIGLVAWLAYRDGKSYVEKGVLKEEVENAKDRKAISDMDDDELDSELRKYWKD